jgi:hypothetical protein
MGQRRIVFVASLALIALLSGCGKRAQTNAVTESDVHPSAAPSGLLGGGATENIALTVNDDGTYHTITLRSPSGRWASLVQRGPLYVRMPDQISGYTLHISVVKDSGTLEGSVLAPSDPQ